MSALQRLNMASKIAPHDLQTTLSETQLQTKHAFDFKWSKRELYEDECFEKFVRSWLFERYCRGSPKKLHDWLAGGRKIILDAGCGSAVSAVLFFAEYLKNHDYLGVDLSSSSLATAKKRFHEKGYPGDFLEADLLSLPIPEESVDLIFSEGVLHHTDDTGKALAHLSSKLKQHGLFLFYVYAKKAPVREYTDDYIRQILSKMSDEKAWEALIPLSQLGLLLGELNLELDIPNDIPFLGIHKGKVNLQRLFYWNICKMFYRPDFTLEQMNFINFDWFRPLNCQRHTKDEVIKFCDNAGLFIENLVTEDSGITVVARKS